MTYQALSRRLQPWKPFLLRLPGLRMVTQVVRFVLDGEFRSECAIRLFRSRDLFQVVGHTMPNRYPALFACLADRLGDLEAPRILSFGCSFGDEILALQRVLPRAQITGIDINPYRIAKARRRIADHRVRLIVAGRIVAEGAPPFDAILCMAVLQRSELKHRRPEDCSAYIRFANFEAMIKDFDRALRPGGLLALYHTNFRFADTPLGATYQPLLSALPLPLDCPKYGRDNRLIVDWCDGREMLYQKLESDL